MSTNEPNKVRLEEARAKLGELVIQVMATGEPITITRYGKSVVDLVPHAEPQSRKGNEA